MTGYAVTARVQRIEFRSPVVQGSSPDLRSGPSWATARPEAALEELGGGSPWERLAELRGDVATAWAQTTFFLFDPESWR
jgi:hypothetical protein